MPNPVNEQLEALSSRGKALALDLMRFQRQEEAQGHVSPLDAAFLGRLRVFLDSELGEGLKEVQAALETQGTRT